MLLRRLPSFGAVSGGCGQKGVGVKGAVREAEATASAPATSVPQEAVTSAVPVPDDSASTHRTRAEERADAPGHAASSRNYDARSENGLLGAGHHGPRADARRGLDSERPLPDRSNDRDSDRSVHRDRIGDIGAGEGSVWASDYNGSVVRRFDAATGKQLAEIRLPGGSAPEGIVDAGGAIWVATHHGGTLVRINPNTNKIAATVVLAFPGAGGPQGVAAGLGSIWVGTGRGVVFRVDPSTNKIAAIIPSPTGMDPCGGIAVGATAVWVTSCLDDTKVARIDPATNKFVSVLDVGGKVVEPAADGDTVWFVAGGDPDSSPNASAYLIRLRADDTVAARIQLPTGFISGGAAVAFGSVWIMDFAHPRVIRVPLPS